MVIPFTKYFWKKGYTTKIGSTPTTAIAILMPMLGMVAEISAAFDIEISPKYLVPENFNSAKAMWNMICKIQEDED